MLFDALIDMCLGPTYPKRISDVDQKSRDIKQLEEPCRRVESLPGYKRLSRPEFATSCSPAEALAEPMGPGRGPRRFAKPTSKRRQAPYS